MNTEVAALMAEVSLLKHVMAKYHAKSVADSVRIAKMEKQLDSVVKAGNRLAQAPDAAPARDEWKRMSSPSYYDPTLWELTRGDNGPEWVRKW